MYTSLFNKLYAYVTLTFGFGRQPLTQRGIYMNTFLINLKLLTYKGQNDKTGIYSYQSIREKQNFLIPSIPFYKYS